MMANEKRLISVDAHELEELLSDCFDVIKSVKPTHLSLMGALQVWIGCCKGQPTVDAVEVVHGHKIGDVCFYGFHDKNKSLALVEIVKILNDERGIAEVKFLKVFVDDTGNGLFDYLLRSGNTMNASFKYLKNITLIGAKMDGGNEDV